MIITLGVGDTWNNVKKITLLAHSVRKQSNINKTMLDNYTW